MPRPKPGAPGREAGIEDQDSERHAGEGLTDLDLYAVLSSGSLGGRNGFTLGDYSRLSDRQIGRLLSVEWDEDGRLVTEASRGRSGRPEPSGSIAAAGRELPPPEELGLSDRDVRELLAVKANVDERYLLMFWSVWSRRGKDREQIREIWTAHLHSEN